MSDFKNDPAETIHYVAPHNEMDVATLFVVDLGFVVLPFFTPSKYLFYGFFPEKEKKIKDDLGKLSNQNFCVSGSTSNCFYVIPDLSFLSKSD